VSRRFNSAARQDSESLPQKAPGDTTVGSRPFSGEHEDLWGGPPRPVATWPRQSMAEATLGISPGPDTPEILMLSFLLGTTRPFQVVPVFGWAITGARHRQTEPTRIGRAELARKLSLHLCARSNNGRTCAATIPKPAQAAKRSCSKLGFHGARLKRSNPRCGLLRFAPPFQVTAPLSVQLGTRRGEERPDIFNPLPAGRTRNSI
jgi:hypothetical protein